VFCERKDTGGRDGVGRGFWFQTRRWLRSWSIAADCSCSCSTGPISCPMSGDASVCRRLECVWLGVPALEFFLLCVLTVSTSAHGRLCYLSTHLLNTEPRSLHIAVQFPSLDLRYSGDTVFQYASLDASRTRTGSVAAFPLIPAWLAGSGIIGLTVGTMI